MIDNNGVEWREDQAYGGGTREDNALRVLAQVGRPGWSQQLWIGNAYCVGQVFFRYFDTPDEVGLDYPPALTVSERAHLPTPPFQELMDSMWALGYRPTGELSNEGERTAMKAHLTDLQQLIFDPKFAIIKRGDDDAAE